MIWKTAGWLASLLIALWALATWAVSSTYCSPTDAFREVRSALLLSGYALAAVTLNPLAWRLWLFDTPTKRVGIIVGIGICFALFIVIVGDVGAGGTVQCSSLER